MDLWEEVDSNSKCIDSQPSCPRSEKDDDEEHNCNLMRQSVSRIVG